MEFTIRGVTFDIDLVNNWVREEHQVMIDLVDSLSEIPDKLESLAAEAEALTASGESTKEKEKELIDGVKKLDQEHKVIKKKILVIRREIVKELLVSNDIEYDESFWRRKCDSNDVNDFMFGCLNKDIKKEGKTSSKK